MQQIRMILVVIVFTSITTAIFGQQGSPSSDSKSARADGQAEATATTNVNADSTSTEGADATSSNAPALDPTTSSQSGSPAILSGGKGEERDGTNTVQRAKMNMVGSPVENLNFDDSKAVDADSEMQDRQEFAQEKQFSAAQDTTANASAGTGAQGTADADQDASTESAGGKDNRDAGDQGKNAKRRVKKKG